MTANRLYQQEPGGNALTCLEQVLKVAISAGTINISTSKNSNTLKHPGLFILKPRRNNLATLNESTSQLLGPTILPWPPYSLPCFPNRIGSLLVSYVSGHHLSNLNTLTLSNKLWCCVNVTYYINSRSRFIIPVFCASHKLLREQLVEDQMAILLSTAVRSQAADAIAGM